MSFITRGFGGRSRDRDDRLPPGQSLVSDFPVLSAGPTPEVDTADWEFTIRTEAGGTAGTGTSSWPCRSTTSTPTSTASRAGRSSARAGAASRSTRCSRTSRPSSEFVMAHSYGGYTTNVPLDELLDGKAWIAFEFDGEPLDPEHGGPARLLVPHLYFWKSAKWVRGLVMMDRGRARILGAERLPHPRRPVEGGAVLVSDATTSQSPRWCALQAVPRSAGTRPPSRRCIGRRRTPRASSSTSTVAGQRRRASTSTCG